MNVRLLRLAFLFALLFPVTAAAIDLPRQQRREANKAEPTRKDDKKDETPRPETEVIKNIAYRDDKFADPDRHKLDLYLPRGKKDFPVVMFVHGGSWKSGNKDEYVKLGELFATEGIGCVIPNYRLSPKVQHPAHIEDVASAFAWTVGNIEKYGGRKDRIFACGHSAGGHLVSLLGTDDKYLSKEGLALKDVRGVIAISGVHEINSLLPMFRNTFGKDKEECRDASPISHVKAGDPPFLLLYADRDLPFLGKMAEDMNEVLKKNKCDAECMKVAHRTHMTIIVMLAQEADSTRDAIFDFIAKHSEWKAPTRPDANDTARRLPLRKKDDK
jgi:acetyl esterase/lipase